MAGLDGTSQAPDGLAPVPVPARGPSGRVALGVVAACLVGLVGIALVGQSGDRGLGSEGAMGGSTGTATARAASSAPSTAAPVDAPPPTAPLSPQGTPPPRVDVAVGPVAACPPESTPDMPGPVDQVRPIEVSATAFDRRAGRIVALGGGGVSPDTVETWTFDVCANTWTRMHPDREPSSGGFGQLIYDVDSDVTIALDGDGRVWTYDVMANTWVVKGAGPPALERPRLVYDPVSGHVVVVGDEGHPDASGLALWSYEVETDTWTPIRQANRPAVEPQTMDFAYDASVDRLAAYGDGRPAGARMWLFDLRTGIWSGTGAVAPPFSYGWGIRPAIAYDEAAERTVILGQGQSAAYDASADRWETLYMTPLDGEPGACETRPECRQMPLLFYDPVNVRLDAYGGQYWTTCTWEAPDDMWAFDPASRSWRLIVPPTPVPPPLRDLAAAGESASAGSDRSPWIRAEKVTLHEGPFFTRIPGVADGGPWSSASPAAAASVADGLFVPECQLWTEGTVWWEETTSDPSSRAWVEIDLGGTFALDAAVVQADVNDEYLLSYRDPKTANWTLLWEVPLGEAGGMATRPQQGDASVRWPLASPVVTDALRFEATSGDAQYSVSEIAVFGRPAP